jgi:hypothetical protein
MSAKSSRANQNHLCNQSKTRPVLSNHQPSAFSKPTFVVNSGTPSNNTHTLPRKIITAENSQP